MMPAVVEDVVDVSFCAQDECMIESVVNAVAAVITDDTNNSTIIGVATKITKFL
jgi:hypothetical protein